MDIKYNYNLAQPENTKSVYTEYDDVDFKLSLGSSHLVGNTIRVLGNVKHLNKEDSELYLADHSAGASMYIEEVMISFMNRGVIETISNYPRLVSMIGNATKSPDETLNSDSICELKAPNDRLSANFVYTEKGDFSLSLNCCLNNIVSDNKMIDPQKTGDITVTLRLARNANTLYGTDYSANDNAYEIRDLRLSYLTAENVQDTSPVVMRSFVTFDGSVDGSYVSLSTNVSAVCTAVSCSFIKQDKIGQAAYNTHQQEKLPGLESVQFLFNDQSNRYITYEIRDYNEIVERYLESFSRIEGNNLNPLTLDSNNSFGVGVNFKVPIDLRSQKFTTIINSAVSNTDPYIMYFYFHSITTL